MSWETEARKKVRPTLKFMANCNPSQYGRPQEELNLPKFFNDFLKFHKIFFVNLPAWNESFNFFFLKKTYLTWNGNKIGYMTLKNSPTSLPPDIRSEDFWTYVSFTFLVSSWISWAWSLYSAEQYSIYLKIFIIWCIYYMFI